MIKPNSDKIKFYFFYPKPKTLEEIAKLTSRDKKKIKGRSTVAAIYNSEDNSLSFGLAICSKKDVFIKEVGRIKAIGRARHNTPILRKHLDKKDKPITIFIEAAKMLEKVSSADSLHKNEKLNKNKAHFAL